MDNSVDPCANRAKAVATLGRVQEAVAEWRENRRRDEELAAMHIAELAEYGLDLPTTAADWHMLAIEHGLDPINTPRSDVAARVVTWARKERKAALLREGAEAPRDLTGDSPPVNIDTLKPLQAAVLDVLTDQWQTPPLIAKLLGKLDDSNVRRVLPELRRMGLAEKSPDGDGYRLKQRQVRTQMRTQT